MGVQGLWSLLEPVGRRVNIEALTNKRLAVGAGATCRCFSKALSDAMSDTERADRYCRRVHMACPVHQSDAQ